MLQSLVLVRCKRILVTSQLVIQPSSCIHTGCLYSLSVPLTLRRWQRGRPLLFTSRFLRLWRSVSFVMYVWRGRKASCPVLCHTFPSYSWSIITWDKPSHSLFQDPCLTHQTYSTWNNLTMTFINRPVYYWTPLTKTHHMLKNTV